MLNYCQMDPQGKTFCESEILMEIETFSLKKMYFKMAFAKLQQFFSGLSVLISH